MSNAAIAGVMVAVMLALIAARVPIWAGMFVAGAVGYWTMVGRSVSHSIL